MLSYIKGDYYASSLKMYFALYISTHLTTLPLTRLLFESEHSNHLCKSLALAVCLIPVVVYASAIIWLALATVIG